MGLHKCIFCLEESDGFNTVEHIVPESLGNIDDILTNAVCDKCQNYLGTEIENFVLSKTPFGFWRTISGTKTKKGKNPFFDPSQAVSKRGKIDNYHPLTDNNITMHPADNESIIEVTTDNDKIRQEIFSGERTNIKVVLTPKMLIYMGRFLGKIALEYWYKAFNYDVFDERFNGLRNYIRYGSVNEVWPVMLGQLTENTLTYKAISKFEEGRTLYAYSFYKDNKANLILFNFDIGCERYSIILNCKYPNGSDFTDYFLSALCNGTMGLPTILHYSLK